MLWEKICSLGDIRRSQEERGAGTITKSDRPDVKPVARREVRSIFLQLSRHIMIASDQNSADLPRRLTRPAISQAIEEVRQYSPTAWSSQVVKASD